MARNDQPPGPGDDYVPLDALGDEVLGLAEQAGWHSDAELARRDRLREAAKKLRGKANGNGEYHHAEKEEATEGRFEDVPLVGEPTAPAAPGKTTEQPRVHSTLWQWEEPSLIPPRDRLYGQLYYRQFVTATVASGGVGKTFLLVAEALALATGKDLLRTGHQGERCRVWFLNGEDPLVEMRRRMMACAMHYRLTANDIGDRVHIDSGRDQELMVAKMANGTVWVNHQMVEDMIAEIQACCIDALLVDPLRHFHRVKENDSECMDAVIKAFAQIASTANCAVHLVHHARKPGPDMEATAESSRGSTAIVDGCRSVRVLNRMTKKEAEQADVEDCRRYFRSGNGKFNLGPPGVDEADWFYLDSVDLGNGDPVGTGVATYWRMPAALDGISVEDLRKAQAAVRAGGPWRQNSQAKAWVGVPIAAALGLELGTRDEPHKANRKKVGRLLKVWMENGMFVAVQRLDENSDMRDFIEVGVGA